jgi:uncharacterized protein YaaN involved in tellurite resistance
MKNKLLLFVVVISLIASPILSSAESATSSNTGTRNEKIKTIKDEIEAKRENLRQEMASRTDAIKTSVQERKQGTVDKIIERVNQFTQNIISRYEAATGRLDKLAGRINSRITKMEAKNIDVTAAKELLATAKTKIETAKTSTAGIISTLNSTSFGTTVAEVKQNYTAIKTQIEKAKEDIGAAHAALADVVNSLKPGQNKLDKENKMASTTKTEN